MIEIAEIEVDVLSLADSRIVGLNVNQIAGLECERWRYHVMKALSCLYLISWILRLSRLVVITH